MDEGGRCELCKRKTLSEEMGMEGLHLLGFSLTVSASLVPGGGNFQDRRATGGSACMCPGWVRPLSLSSALLICWEGGLPWRCRRKFNCSKEKRARETRQ